MAVLLISAVGIWCSGLLMMKTVRLYREIGTADDVGQYEKRFEEIRRILPPFGVVGYRTDERDNLAKISAELNLTQYALSPVIIMPTEKQLHSFSGLSVSSSDNGVSTKQNARYPFNIITLSVHIKGMKEALQIRSLRPSCRDFIVGNFSKRFGKEAVADDDEAVFLQDFHDGVVLLRGR